MKPHFLLFLSLLAAAVGCSSTTGPAPGSSFTNADAAHDANVSGIYELDPFGTVGSWTGIDIKWRDSTGTIRALSAYAGKVVLLTFWATTPPAAASEEHSLDSVQKDLGDSVRIVTVAEDNSFQTVYTYDTLNKIRAQIVIDSTQFADLQYVQLADEKVFWPETFVLRPNGTPLIAEELYVTAHTLDSLVRLAYH